jgi:hypothetical protein
VRSLNTWYHVAGVYDAAAQTLDIYVNGVLNNGVLVGTVPAAQVNAVASANLGRRNGGYHFNGRIDDVRIYERALSAVEILADMNTPLGDESVLPVPTPGEPAPRFALDPGPNPVGGSDVLSLSFRLPEPGRVKLEIFNVLGERVALVLDEDRPGGAHVARYDPARLRSGIYFVRLTAGRQSAVRKVVRVR